MTYTSNCKDMTKIALITGASSGIGRACAHRFAQSGYDLILVARRAAYLDPLQKEIENTYQVRVLQLRLDVRNKQLVSQYLGTLPPAWRNIDVLINNAGLALDLSPVQSGLVEDWECMIDTNVKGLLYVSRMVMPLMIQRGKGQIINICSTAGKEVYPKGNVYCATKHAVDALTQAMRLDLLPYGIRVGQVCPGMVETEFSVVRFKGDTEKAAHVYERIQPLTPEDIADAVLYMASVPPHVNIDDLVIRPTAQGNSFMAHREGDA